MDYLCYASPFLPPIKEIRKHTHTHNSIVLEVPLHAVQKQEKMYRKIRRQRDPGDDNVTRWWESVTIKVLMEVTWKIERNM